MTGGLTTRLNVGLAATRMHLAKNCNRQKTTADGDQGVGQPQQLRPGYSSYYYSRFGPGDVPGIVPVIVAVSIAFRVRGTHATKEGTHLSSMFF